MLNKGKKREHYLTDIEFDFISEKKLKLKQCKKHLHNKSIVLYKKRLKFNFRMKDNIQISVYFLATT